MKVRFRDWDCVTEWSHYLETGEFALVLCDGAGQVVTKATVALPDPAPRASDTQVWLKGWAENDGLPKALETAGVVKRLPVYWPAGLVAEAQLASLTDAALAEIAARYPPNSEQARARLAAKLNHS